MKLSDLPVGALVKDTNTKYNNATIIWQVLEHGHANDGATNTTLCSRDIITLKCFDAKEPSNSDSNRQNYGNGRYLHSNILQWLNSTGAANAWYTAQHSVDQKPDSSSVWANSGTPINPYDTEAGFLTNFSAELRNALQTVTKVTAKNIITDEGGYESVSSKIFLLSTTEVGLANENNVAEGTIYEYYSGANNTNDRRKKNLANDAAKGNYSGASSPWIWWLRTPRSNRSFYTRLVLNDGSLDGDNAYCGHFGVAPAFVISSNTKVSSTTDSDGAYTMVWNTLPTITTDSTSLGNKYEPFSIDYTIDDNNESDTVTYQIKMDGVTLTSGTAILGVEQTFSVTSLIFDTLPWGSHTIRITANDGSGEVYTDISFTVANKALKVVGSTGNIGEISSYVYALNSTKARKRVVPFSMEKANATITLSSSSVTLDSEHTSVTVNVSTNGGTISVESSDTSVATASISNGVITISSVNNTDGNATITVNTAATDNVLAGTATISVTADFLIVSFSSGTDAQIKAMLDAYYQNKITWAQMGWAVGDTRKIHLNAMSAPNPNSRNTWAAQDITIVIVDHDHTDLATPINGHSKACITVQTREVLNNCSAGYNNAGHIYVNGDSSYDMSFTKWANLYMRTFLNNTVLGAIPSGAFKNAIKQITHYCHTAYNTADDELVTDTLFLPSYPEIFGTAANQYYTPTTHTEGTQWSYYETTANRIKYGNNNGVANSTAQYWWEGSTSNYHHSSYGYDWCGVYTNGTSEFSNGDFAAGLAPAFAM